MSCVSVFDKREIRHFHVLVVKRRVRNVQKSVMQSCCFNKRNLLLFWRSLCPHRLRCLSLLILTRAHRTLQNLLSLALISSIWTSHSQVTHIDTNPRPGLASILRMHTATAPRQCRLALISAHQHSIGARLHYDQGHVQMSIHLFK